jgi:hypothetical protein
MSSIHERKIRDWFAQRGAGLILPSGWFGRPHDNVHTLTKIDASNEVLTIVLDERLRLDFVLLQDVEQIGSELLLSGFSRLTFKWQEYGSSETYCEEFTSGIVRFSAPQV